MNTSAFDQLAEVRRELRVRRRVLPSWIGSRLTADQCRHRIEVFEDLVEILEKRLEAERQDLRDNPHQIRIDFDHGPEGSA